MKTEDAHRIDHEITLPLETFGKQQYTTENTSNGSRCGYSPALFSWLEGPLSLEALRRVNYEIVQKGKTPSGLVISYDTSHHSKLQLVIQLRYVELSADETFITCQQTN